MQTRYTFPQRIHHLITGVQADVLNAGQSTGYTGNLLRDMKNVANKLKAVAFTDSKVDYQQLKTGEIYQDYRAISDGLQSFDLNSLETIEERLAFWINLYNLLMIDAVIHYEVQHSITEVKGVFDSAGYNIGGYFFSLNDIEHGILRANAGHPTIPGGQFPQDDPRAKYMMPELDPRIHFALVCAAESCPPINFYDAERIDSQLTLATGNFVNSSEVKIDIEQKQATISKIFQWYAPDFGASFMVTLGAGDASPVLRWIAPYRVDPDEKSLLSDHANDYAIGFSTYNWSLNSLK